VLSFSSYEEHYIKSIPKKEDDKKLSEIFRKFKKTIAFCKTMYYYKLTKINWTITEEDSIFI